MIGQDRVQEVLQNLGPMTYREIVDKLVDQGETGNVSYSVIKALHGLKKWGTIDYTISKEKPFRGSKPRIYRVINSV